ncbi:hypothetical protein B0H19DRAFT_1071792 [Mycena capillaripes]|nr:hypothetical protein B0H19DRAFT_1071792 [Mycena capillaripes]
MFYSPDGLINYTVPFFNILLRQPNLRDWNYTMIPVPGLNGRTSPFPQGGTRSKLTHEAPTSTLNIMGMGLDMFFPLRRRKPWLARLFDDQLGLGGQKQLVIVMRILSSGQGIEHQWPLGRSIGAFRDLKIAERMKGSSPLLRP